MRSDLVRRCGFTLIEVIGALLIFSVGVIMVLSVTSALSRRMEYSAVKSVINVQGQHRMDSLMTQPYAAVSVGTTTTSLTVRGISYTRRLQVTQKSPLLRVAYLRIYPATSVWPTFADSTYVRDVW